MYYQIHCNHCNRGYILKDLWLLNWLCLYCYQMCTCKTLRHKELESQHNQKSLYWSRMVHSFWCHDWDLKLCKIKEKHSLVQMVHFVIFETTHLTVSINIASRTTQLLTSTLQDQPTTSSWLNKIWSGCCACTKGFFKCYEGKWPKDW